MLTFSSKWVEIACQQPPLGASTCVKLCEDAKECVTPMHEAMHAKFPIHGQLITMTNNTKMYINTNNKKIYMYIYI
jgi:hypothetical protein